MISLELEITLMSDTTFGRGDGHAGVVNQEVEYDPKTGLPFIKGRTVKGLLVEECSNILYTVDRAKPSLVPRLKECARRLFGQPGSHLEDQAMMRIGPALLPDDFRRYIEAAVTPGRNQQYRPDEILEAMTTIYRQTAVSSMTGAPKRNSLRAVRAILRGTVFFASLLSQQDLRPDDLGLLAACAAAVRRAGTSRNRGRGKLSVRLVGDGVDHNIHLQYFTDILSGG